MAKQVKVEGFYCTRWLARYPEGMTQIIKWIDEGKIQYKETVREGFDKMPQTFMALFTGDCIGKMIVKV